MTNYYDTSRNTQNEIISNTRDYSYAKSIYSVICIALIALGIIAWIVIILIGVITGQMVFGDIGNGMPIIIASLLFFLCAAGVPWGWSIFWPFWRDHLGGGRFLVIHIGFLSFIIDFFFYIIRWVLLPVLCFAFGWINMLVHIPVIVRNVKSNN